MRDMESTPSTGRLVAPITAAGDSTRDAVVVAIHQPNFFPWLGYFDKLARADIFVVLDSVQFPKKQGTWMNRVRVLADGVPRWLTVPVDRTYHGVRSVQEMRIAPDAPWRRETSDLLRHCYAKAPFFDAVASSIEDLVAAPHDLIAELNLTSLAAVVDRVLPGAAAMVRSSELDVDGAATDLLIATTKAVGGTVYLSGDGADGYQDDARFAEQGLELQFQNFAPQPYAQIGSKEFVPGLSVLDALFNLGFEGTAALLDRVPRARV
jgi:hypothetical protein